MMPKEDSRESPQDPDPSAQQVALRVPKRKPIKKDKRKEPQKPNYKLVWTFIQKIYPLRHLLILPGDCILPLSNMSLHHLVEDLYIKNSSMKAEGNIELTLSRKVKPFRNVEILYTLLQKVPSQYVPKLKQLLLGDYRNYIEKKRIQRISSQRSAVKDENFEDNLRKFLKSMSQTYYRYQIRNANQEQEMQMKRVGYSEDMLALLYPESTDVLVQSTPNLFSNLDNYLKYMFYNLASLVNGGQMEWVDIELETSDEYLIQTRFKNIYYASAHSRELATITLFEISPKAVQTVRNMRRDSCSKNVLVKVNPEAEKFFNRFYSSKQPPPKAVCSYAPLPLSHS